MRNSDLLYHPPSGPVLSTREARLRLATYGSLSHERVVLTEPLGAIEDCVVAACVFIVRRRMPSGLTAGEVVHWLFGYPLRHVSVLGCEFDATEGPDCTHYIALNLDAPDASGIWGEVGSDEHGH